MSLDGSVGICRDLQFEEKTMFFSLLCSNSGILSLASGTQLWFWIQDIFLNFQNVQNFWWQCISSQFFGNLHSIRPYSFSSGWFFLTALRLMMTSSLLSMTMFVSSVRSSSGYHGLIHTYTPLFQIFQILQILKWKWKWKW